VKEETALFFIPFPSTAYPADIENTPIPALVRNRDISYVTTPYKVGVYFKDPIKGFSVEKPVNTKLSEKL
jgi:hypothetical protein